MTRSERANYLWHRLVVRIGQDVPPGSGNDPRVWAAVEGPSRRVFEAERAYLAGGDERPLVAAMEDLLRAWRRAAGVEEARTP